MTLAEFVIDVRTGMKDAAYRLLAEEDYEDQVLRAVIRYSRYRPRIRSGSLALIVGLSEYPAPKDFISSYLIDWGREEFVKKPWERGARPLVTTFATPSLPERARPQLFKVDEQLYIHPAPTADQVASFGATFSYFYNASHSVTDSLSTVPPADDPLVKVLALEGAAYQIASDSTQGDTFMKRYNQLGKYYGEQFKQLIGDVRPLIVRG